MTYENNIPEFAMKPARAPNVDLAEGIYDTEKIIYPSEKQSVLYQFEEDILVPDTKADMSKILLMDATADIMPSEKKISPKTDDLLNITGNICIQTIYSPEEENGSLISITSKVPYKYQWSLNPRSQAEGVFDCKVKTIEYMIINERKFRVKITLEFLGQLFCERSFSFFAGLTKEPLQLKRKRAEMNALELIKKDEISIDEAFKGKDTGFTPQYILKQDFQIVENYRQLTTEKIVINGFIFVSLLYCAANNSEEPPKEIICQHNQRVEFTQFVPIEKEYRNKKFNSVKLDFTSKTLGVTIKADEENIDQAYFHLLGEVQTRIELYSLHCREMIVDAYHLSKNFSCKFSEEKILNLSDMATSEVSVREIINLPERSKGTEAVFCQGKPLSCNAVCERGKVVVTGELSATALWKDIEGNYYTEKAFPDFRTIIDNEGITGQQQALGKAIVKSAWVEIINEKQIEVNYTILVCVETMTNTSIILLEEPAFIDVQGKKEYPMAIATVKDLSLWEIAKKYKTTEEKIRKTNKLEAEAEPGRKILIIK